MSKLLRLMTLWLWGGFLYYIIEILWRGYSHTSMFVLGGLCFVLIGGVNNWLPWSMGIVWQALIGAAAVTMIELISGIIINLWLGWGVWDYSQMPLNFLGQICLTYSVIWIPLSVIGIWLDDYLRWTFSWGDKPRYSFL